ncbi:tyrosine kinase receptor Cad96Ca-like [Montipora capricornis]|uniref:tyrosine kinase receptor Cad96Ca-like n=1 Tax=Montipora capricornis TaxID=246305 RepID=UPI0035F1EE78
METRCGSVVVYLTLRFLRSVGGNEAISTLVDAARQNKFGNFIVDPNSIKELVSMSSASPTSTRITKECQCTCGTTLLVIIGVLVFIIILLILVIVWQHRKLGVARKKRPYKVAEDRRIYDNEVATEELNPTNDPPSSSNQQLRIPIELAYMPLQGTTHYDVGPSSPNNSAQNVEYAPLDIRTRSWEVTREDVKVEKIIGKGAFGQVAKGTARNLPLHSGTKTVAVKMLKANAPESDKRDLKSELDLMKTLKPHPHVIKLLGCVTETDRLLVLIEYVPYGDLFCYLRKSRGLNDTYYKDPDIKPQTSLTSQQLMKFAWQIADGMSYLSLRKIIHRDLAARNVLVGEKETCKVTDFGMARDVQQENIYERKTRGRLPVKWTAYESLLYGKYTTKSDVWSYGVLLYEIFTVGGSPYPQMDGKKIASLLQQGYRMPKP